MATLQGALVRVDDVPSFVAEASRHRISVEPHSEPGWWLIDCPPQYGRLGPPAFSMDLSAALRTTVIAFFAQTTASVEHLQHWENGALKRDLQYELESGGWITQEGPLQAWESTYFFSEHEGTEDGKRWPRGLPDDISDADLDRYNRAKESGNPSEIMDLLGEGDIARLCQSYGIDLQRPHAHHHPPPNLKPWLILGLVVGGLVLALVSGALI